MCRRRPLRRRAFFAPLFFNGLPIVQPYTLGYVHGFNPGKVLPGVITEKRRLCHDEVCPAHGIPIADLFLGPVEQRVLVPRRMMLVRIQHETVRLLPQLFQLMHRKLFRRLQLRRVSLLLVREDDADQQCSEWMD